MVSSIESTNLPSPNPAQINNVQQPPNYFTAPDQNEKGLPAPDPSSGEIERLIDLHGLLEIARLIEEVKKDGRLNSKGSEQHKRADAHLRKRMKD